MNLRGYLFPESGNDQAKWQLCLRGGDSVKTDLTLFCFHEFLQLFSFIFLLPATFSVSLFSFLVTQQIITPWNVLYDMVSFFIFY